MEVSAAPGGGGKGTPTTTTSRADTGACTSIDENLLLGPDHPLTVVTADQPYHPSPVVAGAASRVWRCACPASWWALTTTLT